MNTPKQDSTNRTTPDSILYIDDTTVNICKQPNQTLQQSLNQTLSTIKNYMEMNKLVMNNGQNTNYDNEPPTQTTTKVFTYLPNPRM